MKRDIIGISVLLIALGSLCFAGALLPFSWISSITSQYPVNGSMEALSEPRWHAIGELLVACGVVALLNLLLVRQHTDQVRQHIMKEGEYWRALLVSVGGRDRWFTIMLLIISASLRAVFLDWPVRIDEAHTYFLYATRSLDYILAVYSFPNNHLLHSIATHFCLSLFGDSLLSLRGTAFISGSLVPIIVFGIIRLERSAMQAFFGGVLSAICPSLIGYSVYARGYSSIVLFSGLSLLIVGVALKQKTCPLPWLSIGILGALEMFCVPTGALPFFALLLALAGKLENLRGIACALMIGCGLAFIEYRPVIVVSGLSALIGNEFVAPLSMRQVIDSAPGELLGMLRLWIWPIPIPFLIVLLPVFISSYWKDIRLKKWSIPLFLARYVVTAIVIGLCIHRPFLERVWLFLLVPLLCFSVSAIDFRRAVIPSFAAVSFLALGFLANVPVQNFKMAVETADLIPNSFPDAYEIVNFIKGREGHYAVRATYELNQKILEYYFRNNPAVLRNISLPPREADELLVVANNKPISSRFFKTIDAICEESHCSSQTTLSRFENMTILLLRFGK